MNDDRQDILAVNWLQPTSTRFVGFNVLARE